MLLDDLLVEAKPLYLDSTIDDLGHLKNIPTSLKHINGKYIICNAASAKRDGIAIEDYVGLTAYELGRLTNRKQTVTTNTVEVDKKLCAKEVPYAIYKHAVLAHDRSIVVEEVCKRPVLGSRDQIAAILGCAQNITHHVHPMLLFNLYESFVPKQEAIESFLRYKKLDTLLKTTVTRDELLTLITMRDSQEVTFLAKQINYTIQEIERYQAQLRDKFSCVDLNEVLAFL